MFALSSIAWGIITLLAYGVFGGWALVRALKKSDEPERLLIKWIVTGLVVVAGAVIVPQFTKSGGPERAFAVPIAAVLGIILGAIWAPSIGAIAAKPFTSMFDGGDEPPDPAPFYSIAQARRKQGKYDEAIGEVQKQLELFPNDYAG